MTQITAPSPSTAPDATAAMPENDAPQPRTGPLRSGNPRGNLDLRRAEPARGLDPRGAKARRTGCACRGPAMANGRCPAEQVRGQAPHGGSSSGARTPEGLARLARSHTGHGNHGAAARAKHRAQRTLVIRSRVAAAMLLRPYLPRDLRERIARGCRS